MLERGCSGQEELDTYSSCVAGDFGSLPGLPKLVPVFVPG